MDQQQPQAPVHAPVVPRSAGDAAQDVQINRDIAALGYVWILSVVVYFSKRNSPFVRFHARQGIVLFVLSILVWFIPIVGQFLELIILALAVLGFLGAAQGQWKEVPLVGPLARRDVSGVRKSWRSLLDSMLHGWHSAKDDHAPTATPPPSASASPSHTVAPIPPSPVPSNKPEQPQPSPPRP